MYLGGQRYKNKVCATVIFFIYSLYPETTENATSDVFVGPITIKIVGE